MQRPLRKLVLLSFTRAIITSFVFYATRLSKKYSVIWNTPMKHLLTLLFITIHLICIAQVAIDRKNWSFGLNSYIGFDADGVNEIGSLPLMGLMGSASYTNKQGNMMLSVDLRSVHNRISGSMHGLGTAMKDALIIPKNEEETLFYILIINEDNEVRSYDYNRNLNTLTLNEKVLLSNSADHFTAVKHCFLDAYWLITIDQTDKFYTFLISSDQIGDPVVSQTGGLRTSTGDIRSSFDGTKLAVSNYYEDWVELYDINKNCGDISFVRRLGKLDPADDRPLGVCFAPDDRSLYVAWGYWDSRVAQYPLDQPGTIYNAFTYTENINSLEIGYDGRMYIGVHENGNLSRRIHSINSPNAMGGGNRATLDAIQPHPLSSNGWEFPNFIQNHTGGQCEGTDIWTSLGKEYYICDLENETTVLDAGKGFKTYKWTPTGDTTQWIEVKTIGEYIVVVKAYDGCQGNSSTVVKRRCELNYFIPNAFTPNRDALNSTFKAVGDNIDRQTIQIYNRWGQKVYEGADWDGADALPGVYAYSITLTGFKNKIQVQKTEKGIVHLIR